MTISHKNISPNPLSHTLVFETGATVGLKAGDRIFISDPLSKVSTEILINSPDEAIGLQLFGDDPASTNVDGFVEGGRYLIQIKREQNTLDVNLQFALNWDAAHFKTGGMSLVKSMEISDGLQYSGAISFYPNPAKDKLFFNTFGESIHIVIFAVDGSRIMEREISQAVLDISKLNSGLYYMQVRSVKVEQVFKLIKQ